MLPSGPRAAAQPVPRPRLLRRLAGSWKVAVLSAPAGYGKSTLVRQWMRVRPCIWHTLEPDDRDTAHLLGSLIAAGLRGRPPIGARTLRLFRARRDMERDGGLLTSSFLNELIPRSGARFVVIENVHVLADARESIAWLRNVMEESGPRVRFVLVCRGPCPVPLARFELHGGLVRLERDDLEFDDAERKLLLRGRRGASVAHANLLAIEEMIGGWPAGWALIMRGGGESRTKLARNTARVDADLQDFESTRERIFTFLAEELLSPLPDDLQVALCKSALLEELDADILEAILGRKMAEATLREARRLDLLVQEPQGSATPARYHPLFERFLRERLSRIVPEGDRKRLAAVAVRRHVERGEIARAARIHRATGDDAAALTLVERHLTNRAPKQPPSNQTPANLGPIAAEILRDPRAAESASHSAAILHAAASHALTTGHPADTARWSARCREILLRERRYPSLPAVVRNEATAAHITGRIAETAAVLDDLIEAIPAAEKRVRGLVTVHAANLRLYCGEPEKARRMLAGAHTLLHRGALAIDRARLREAEANILFSEGRWDSYVAIIREILPVYRAHGLHAHAQSFLINMADAHVYLGREDEALRLLDEAEGLVSRTVLRDAIVGIAVGRARASMDLGDHPAAAKWLDAGADGADRFGSRYYASQIDIWRGVLERRRGHHREAVAHLDRGIARFGAGAPHWTNLARMERALALGLQRTTVIEEAVRELRDCRRISVRLGDPNEAARNRLYEARLTQRSGGAFRPILLQALRAMQRTHHLVALRKERDLSEPLLREIGPDLPSALRASLHAYGIPVNEHVRPPRGRPGRRSPAPVRGSASSARPSTIEIRLLGGCEIRVAGAEVRLPRRASSELIARLALRPGEPIPREVIAESLWPGTETRASRNRFDVALNAARRALEPNAGPRGPFEILRLDGGLCRLDANRVAVDVKEFEKAAARCAGFVARTERLRREGGPPMSRDVTRPALEAMREAAAIYRGELLPEHRYAEWTQADRERLRDLHTRIQLGIGAASLTLGRTDDAIAIASGILERDPCHEDAELLLLESFAARGDRLAVSRSYESFDRRLRRSMGFPPGPELTAVYRKAMERTWA